jgi:hypothetical protein
MKKLYLLATTLDRRFPGLSECLLVAELKGLKEPFASVLNGPSSCALALKKSVQVLLSRGIEVF